MRVRELGMVFGVAATLALLSCNTRFTVDTDRNTGFNTGNCAGCLLSAEDGLFTFIVRTGADYEALAESCFPPGLREGWLPPGPGDEEQLVYVSRKGSGCRGCLDVVGVRETAHRMIVEVEGRFQGACEMLIVPGAWALIPRTDKPVVFQFHEVDCPEEPESS